MVLLVLGVRELVRPPTSSTESDFSPGFLAVGEPKCLPLAVTVVLNHSAVSLFSRETTRRRSLGASCAHIFLARDLRLYCLYCLHSLFTSSHNICVCEESHPQTRLGLRKIDLRDYSRIKRGRNK